MKFISRTLVPLVAIAAIFGACSDATSPDGLLDANHGRVVVRLTDAPFLTDSVKSVDVFVLKVEGRVAEADDAAAEQNVDDGGKTGWQTLASPNASFNLMNLQNGVSTTIGDATLTAGTYSGLRLIIDQDKSSVTLKNGTVLNGNDGIKFPSAGHSGIKVQLSAPLKIVGGSTTNLLVDFDVNGSFVMRGNSIEKNGLLFKPVVKATITDAATVNATFRFANATANALSVLQSGNALGGATAIAYGTSSTCSSVNAATPALSVIQVGSATPLAGFTPTFAVGKSYTVLAYPNATGGVQFSTLLNEFTPTSGQAGLRVFNASGLATAVDVYVGAGSTATVANVANGASSAFVSIPAGSSAVHLTNTGVPAVLFDAGSQMFDLGKNVTLVVAPPAAATPTVPRVFLVVGC